MEMTVKEAAEYLGVSTKTIRKRIKAGKFPETHQEPFSGGFRWIVEVGSKEKPGEPTREAQAGPNGELVLLLMTRNAELQEKVGTLERELGRAQGRGFELENQLRLLAGPRPGLVERVKQALWGGA